MPEKEKLYTPDFFPMSTTEKTTVGAGKNGPFACSGKRNVLCAGIFSGVHSRENRCGRWKKWSDAYWVFFLH